MLGMALKQHLLLALESGTVCPVTLKIVNPLSFSSQKSKIGFLKTALTSNDYMQIVKKCLIIITIYVPFISWNASPCNDS